MQIETDIDQDILLIGKCKQKVIFNIIYFYQKNKMKLMFHK